MIVKVKTSVNISEDVRGRITYAAKIAGITRSSIVSKILNKVMSEHESMMDTKSTVKYQKNQEGNKWCCLHVSFEVEDYRFFTGMRYFFNQSVSSLVAYAVNKFIDQYILNIIKSYKTKSSDNYGFHDYHLTKEINDHYICWKVYWLNNRYIRSTGFT
jgi:hypothetical protein